MVFAVTGIIPLNDFWEEMEEKHLLTPISYVVDAFEVSALYVQGSTSSSRPDVKSQTPPVRAASATAN